MTGATGGPSLGNENAVAESVDDTAGPKSATAAAALDDDVQDTTAETLFQELKADTDVEGSGVYDDASADSILEDAEGHDYRQFGDEYESLTADEDVNDLLIPERSEGDEFRWVQTGSASSADGADVAESGDAAGPTGDGATDAETDDTSVMTMTVGTIETDRAGEDGVEGVDFGVDTDDLFGERTADEASDDEWVSYASTMQQSDASADDETADADEDAADAPTADDAGEDASATDEDESGGLLHRILSFFGLR